MSEIIIQSADCCNPCDDPVVSQVPGPAGAAGAAGTNGTNGVNAYTATTANFAMPAVGANSASIAMGTSAWMTVGQVVFVQGAGYMEVISKADATHAVLKNLGYTGNAAPTTVISSTATIAPGGLVGTAGAAGVSTLDSVSPTTTKGDIIVDNGINSPAASDVRMAVGTNGTFIKANSAQATGLQYTKVDLANTAEVTGTLPIGNGGTNGTTRTTAFNNLAPASAALGDLLYFDGTNWVRLPVGGVTQVLTRNASSLPVWTDRGRLMQVYSVDELTTESTSAVIPFDDTKPQVGEGTSLFGQVFTPKDPSASRIFVQVLVNLCADALDNIILALFKDGAADAVAAVSIRQFVANQPQQIILQYFYAQSGGAAITFDVRYGTGGGANLHVNGIDNGSGVAVRRLGGAQTSQFRIHEYSNAS